MVSMVAIFTRIHSRKPERNIREIGFPNALITKFDLRLWIRDLKSFIHLTDGEVWAQKFVIITFGSGVVTYVSWELSISLRTILQSSSSYFYIVIPSRRLTKTVSTFFRSLEVSILFDDRYKKCL